MIPSAKQHALAWRMRRDPLWAHSDRGQNRPSGELQPSALLARSPREIPASFAAAWPQPDCVPDSRVRR